MQLFPQGCTFQEVIPEPVETQRVEQLDEKQFVNLLRPCLTAETVEPEPVGDQKQVRFMRAFHACHLGETCGDCREATAAGAVSFMKMFEIELYRRLSSIFRTRTLSASQALAREGSQDTC